MQLPNKPSIQVNYLYKIITYKNLSIIYSKNEL